MRGFPKTPVSAKTPRTEQNSKKITDVIVPWNIPPRTEGTALYDYISYDRPEGFENARVIGVRYQTSSIYSMNGMQLTIVSVSKSKVYINSFVPRATSETISGEIIITLAT